jgi:hypothetical protein
MFWAMVPSAFLCHNFAIFKAVLSDYALENNVPESERAGKIGLLGMAVGLAFIIGSVASVYCRVGRHVLG